MNRYFFTLSLLFILSACSSEAIKDEEGVVKTSQAETTPNSELIVEIKGMMCVKGCGSAIRKDLYATKAIGAVSFEEDSESENYVTKIEFDGGLISTEEIEEIISNTNNGQFTIISSKTAVIKTPSTSKSKDKSQTTKTNSIESSYDDLSVPNLFDVFKQFFLK